MKPKKSPPAELHMKADEFDNIMRRALGVAPQPSEKTAKPGRKAKPQPKKAARKK